MHCFLMYFILFYSLCELGLRLTVIFFSSELVYVFTVYKKYKDIILVYCTKQHSTIIKYVNKKNK